MEHDINALRMEIDTISQGQHPDADEDVSYVYYENGMCTNIYTISSTVILCVERFIYV